MEFSTATSSTFVHGDCRRPIDESSSQNEIFVVGTQSATKNPF